MREEDLIPAPRTVEDTAREALARDSHTTTGGSVLDSFMLLDRSGSARSTVRPAGGLIIFDEAPGEVLLPDDDAGPGNAALSPPDKAPVSALLSETLQDDPVARSHILTTSADFKAPGGDSAASQPDPDTGPVDAAPSNLPKTGRGRGTDCAKTAGRGAGRGSGKRSKATKTEYELMRDARMVENQAHLASLELDMFATAGSKKGKNKPAGSKKGKPTESSIPQQALLLAMLLLALTPYPLAVILNHFVCALCCRCLRPKPIYRHAPNLASPWHTTAWM